jgi:ABC-type transport system involved in cytochrome c biogenesis permease subunit
MQKLMAFVALAVITGFLGILAFRVPTLDLLLVLVLTLGLAAYDMISSAFRKSE